MDTRKQGSGRTLKIFLSVLTSLLFVMSSERLYAQESGSAGEEAFQGEDATQSVGEGNSGLCRSQIRDFFFILSNIRISN